METHADILSRILFIFAKLNPGIKYVQGMNEVLAMLYFTLWFGGSLMHRVELEQEQHRGDTSQLKDFGMTIDYRHFEADLFHCFTKIMEHLRDGFLRELDREASGLDGHIKRYDNILHVSDETVWEILVEQAQVTHQFYCLRWFMLLMCQEFNLGCTMRLWDTLLAAEGPPPPQTDEALGFSGQDDFELMEVSAPESRINRFAYVDFVAVALVKNVRMRILNSESDFAECMESLQQTAGSFKTIPQLELLLQASADICMRWISWLRNRQDGLNESVMMLLGDSTFMNAGSSHTRTTFVSPVADMTVIQRVDTDPCIVDKEDYQITCEEWQAVKDEDLLDEYGEEAAYEKYLTQQVYQEIIGNPQ